MSGAPKLVVHELSKVFDTGKESVRALEAASLELAENEFVSLVGTSGCVKSTLL